MKPLAALALLVLVALAGGRPAHAELYRLEGRFQCLEKPDAVCYDATPSMPMPAPAAAPHGKGAPTPLTGPEAAWHRPAAKPTTPDAHGTPPEDPLRALAARVLARKPGAGDIATLQAGARAGDARALELLAWCELAGIGLPRDPVAAYLHYGEAAAAGRLEARRNQAAIYERALTSAERQQVLDIENGRLAQAR